jgi:NAD(P)-dependent dehydrogenase (short-subunit alcohol dehydrogenase family)
MINYELHGKVAVVTGGASGIGLACAHVLARSGAAVSLWDLNADALEKAVAEGPPSRAKSASLCRARTSRPSMAFGV